MSMLSASTIGEIASKKYRCVACVRRLRCSASASVVRGPVATIARQSDGTSATGSRRMRMFGWPSRACGLLREEVAVHGQGGARRHPRVVRDLHDEGAEPAHLLLEEAG